MPPLRVGIALVMVLFVVSPATATTKIRDQLQPERRKKSMNPHLAKRMQKCLVQGTCKFWGETQDCTMCVEKHEKVIERNLAAAKEKTRTILKNQVSIALKDMLRRGEVTRNTLTKLMHVFDDHKEHRSRLLEHPGWPQPDVRRYKINRGGNGLRPLHLDPQILSFMQVDKQWRPSIYAVEGLPTLLAPQRGITWIDPAALEVQSGCVSMMNYTDLVCGV